ncbi:phosphate ABC transporter membrane protein 1, PhoT family [Alkalithermobacter thermoalcaliphilus JW-YL-7 = DSM 7308]|uniref:Phosphate transport system permease protein n=1 Tax=Alkalithermobacter thermoalcaliphilus JW-YL-7 = DSM 7308 TaxID=1121328 RepID=A0A150FU41_CLOPD|nr:phosphate ABC transporter, inner membrane subunit PstC [[Clostridium] paradoxum JW-YL-7 = DSM 7308]SHL34255.1 phosphate ABC transporter membrane protein 1, PhoT family [[Clostridium] paradoxum JW-YL-7 = DSM 7308]
MSNITFERKDTDLNRKAKDKLLEFIIEKTIFIFGITSIIVISLIFIFLFRNGIRVFNDVSPKEFFFSKNWFPISVNPQYGILPLVAGSLMVTTGAVFISVPLGIGCAIFISEVAPPKLKTVLKVIIEFLSAIPSVVLGFLGIVVLSNWVRITFNLSSGFTVLTGSILVSFMALPTIITISDDAINALPKEYKEASLALGASKWETIFHVLLPAASSGIIAAVMLGIGRAIGETMTVMMVTGNAAQIPDSFLQPGRTMTATIAAEMGDTVRNGTHYNALFAVGIVLLIMTSIINLIADFVLSRASKEGR